MNDRCDTCNGHGYVYRCHGCGTLYRHIHKYSDCGNARCDGERSTDIKCEDCGGTGKNYPRAARGEQK